MLKIENLSVRIGNFELKDISFNINKNEYFVLLGPTGSGKTTLIKTLCGFLKLSSGRILWNNNDITNLEIEKRNFGYLPQNYKLFPHLNVRENIMFGLNFKKIERNEKIKRFNKIIKILKIENLINREIFNLSGGETQKVALARALITFPSLLFLDEPFSAIDPQFKLELSIELKKILKKFNIMAFHITHNLDEAYILADKIGIIFNGKIEQIGKKDEIFLKPKNEIVAKFLGIKNIFEGIVTNVYKNKIEIEFNELKIVALNENGLKKYEKVKFCIRPEDIKIIKENLPIREELKDNVFDGKIIEEYFYKDFAVIKVKVQGTEFELKFPKYIYQRHNLYNGKKIKIGIWQKGINIFFYLTS